MCNILCVTRCITSILRVFIFIANRVHQKGPNLKQIDINRQENTGKTKEQDQIRQTKTQVKERKDPSKQMLA